MHIEVNVPDLPESVSDATLLDWHKQPGEWVKKNESLIDIETDKVVLEIPAPEDGLLKEVLHQKGDLVKSGERLAILDTEGQASTPSPVTHEIAEKPVPTANLSSAGVRKEVYGPSVRRLMMEHQMSAESIPMDEKPPTKQEVPNHLGKSDIPHTTRVDAVTPSLPSECLSVPGSEKPGDRRVPMTRLRTRIAERLLHAQRSTATLTTFNEVNLNKIFELRQQYREKFEKRYQTKLGLMAFFVKATVEALQRYPILNASVEGDHIVYHDYYHIGVAVSTERGLVVPVLRDADQLRFPDIEQFIVDFSKKGREGKLTLDELQGGTFTITNGGIFGSMLSTPILNPPQSAILGMHAIKDRPVAENGQVVIRPMIYLALSYDHRIIDGREAVSGLLTIKETLEDPARLLLGV